MKSSTVFLIALLAVAARSASAQTTLSLWNFNSPIADANTATGTLAPAVGSGTVTAIGGAAGTFASGDASGGSSDPATGDDSAWNLTPFPQITANSGTAGLRFGVSTLGAAGLSVSFDLRTSNTGSRYWQFQYTTDGSSYLPFGGATINGTEHILTSGGGDLWNNGWAVDLSSVPAVDNNASFGFQLVSVFSPEGFTQTTGGLATYGANAAYRAANTDDRAYATSGTARFDMVRVAQIPEPSTLGLVSLGLLALLGRRHHA